MVFRHLSYPDIRLWDEGTNADVVASSLEAGTFPSLSTRKGPFFEKPPLWYYAASASVAALGYDALPLRLPAAVAGFALILIVGGTVARWHSPWAAAVAVLFLLGCGQLFVFKPNGIFATHHIRSADSDIVQVLGIFGAFLAFGAAAEGRAGGLHAGAALTGLAVLAKGPLGFLPALVFAVQQIASRARPRFRGPTWAAAALVLGIVVVPWHAYMVVRHGQRFVDEYFLHAVVQRVAGTIEEHASPWYSYLQLLRDRAVCCSAEIVAAACIVPLLADRRRILDYRTAAPLLSVVVLMTTISAMQTKLAWYVLPLYPFAAVLVGGLFETCRRVAGSSERALVLRVVAGAGAIAIFLNALAYTYRNARDVERLKRGWMGEFFEASVARCGGDLSYEDARLPGDLLFLLEKHRVALRPRGESRCFIGWRDRDAREPASSPYRRVEEKGHLSLWMR